MKIIERLDQVEEDIGITLGNFDGVHMGHQELLKSIRTSLKEINAKLLVITFVPHPLVVLKSASRFLINSYEDRVKLLDKCGVDYLMTIPFTRDFSTLSPIDFLNKYLHPTGYIKKIFIGHDFAFGENKSGGREAIYNWAIRNDIDFDICDEYLANGIRSSSTLIRNHIEKGEISKANQLLGRKYFLHGRVIKGKGRGKKIGFPTANIDLSNDLILPAKGVYATETLVDGCLYKSLTNVGSNPTFEDTSALFVETHILDFCNDIYGEEISVNFLKKIRDEKKFPSVNDLVSQIMNDKKIREAI